MSDERSLGSGLKQLVGLTLLFGLIVGVGILLVPFEEPEEPEARTESARQAQGTNEARQDPEDEAIHEETVDAAEATDASQPEELAEAKKTALKTARVVKKKAARGATVVKEKARDVWEALKAKGWWPSGAPEPEEPEEEPEPTPQPVARQERQEKPKAKVLILPRITDPNEEDGDKPDVYEWVGSVDQRMSTGSSEARRSLASASCETNQRMREAACEANALASSSPGKSKRDAGGAGGKSQHSSKSKSTQTVSPGSMR